tara:strand:+ start:1759 stop:3360 length:1602 start_codon:yes stop_codon:yes gene_type:complete
LVSSIIKNKNLIFLFLIILLFELVSINFARYNYDGFHLGFILSSSYELDNGKYIYKDFFYPYGILNLYLNNILLKIFNYNIFHLYIFYIQIYIIGIIFFYRLVKSIINIQFATFSIIVLFLLHPYVLKPWHNYLLFFLVNLFIYFKFKNTLKNDLLASFILGISFLFSETFFLASFLIFILDLILSYKFFRFKNIFYKFIIFLSPLLIFFIYLNYAELYNIWLKSTNTFTVLLGYFYKKNFLDYLLSYFVLLSSSYKNILTAPYIFFYFIIFLTNILFILLNLKAIIKSDDNKKIFLFFLACLNLILISQSLNNISIFKLVTLSSFGLIVLLYLIDNANDIYLKKGSMIVVISLCIMTFYNENLNKLQIKHEMISAPKNNLSFIGSQKYDQKTWQNLKYLNTSIFKIKQKCKIDYFVNFTNDAFYYFILRKNFKSLQYFHWFQNIPRNFQNTFYLSLYNNFDRGINKKIRKQIDNNNIIFVTDFYNQNKIKFISDDINYDYEYIEFKNYYFINLPYSDIHGKKILLIPNNCKF